MQACECASARVCAAGAACERACMHARESAWVRYLHECTRAIRVRVCVQGLCACVHASVCAARRCVGAQACMRAYMQASKCRCGVAWRGVAWRGVVWRGAARGGAGRGGAARRVIWYFVHRLVCFNTWGTGWGNPHGLQCDASSETHHFASGLLQPWRNSCRRRMLALSLAQHRQWHDSHPRVCNCLPRRSQE